MNIVEFRGYICRCFSWKPMTAYPLLRGGFPKEELRIIVRISGRGTCGIIFIPPVKYFVRIWNNALFDEVGRSEFRRTFPRYFVNSINFPAVPDSAKRRFDIFLRWLRIGEIFSRKRRKNFTEKSIPKRGDNKARHLLFHWGIVVIS